MKRVHRIGKTVVLGVVAVAAFSGLHAGLVYGTCYDMVGCVRYTSGCQDNPCDQPNCGREYDGAFQQTDQVIVYSGGWQRWEHGSTQEICYRSRACRHSGDPCPEDPSDKVCAPSTTSQWTYYYTWSNNIMSEPCE